MDAKSTKPVRKKAADEHLDRPFDAAVLQRAGEIASRYRLILEADPDVGYIGCALEMPQVFADGRTADACVSETVRALTAAVATMLELGQTPPSPTSERRREEQINIRVSSEEKLRLQEVARSRGFRGVSDFIRTTLLTDPGV